MPSKAITGCCFKVRFQLLAVSSPLRLPHPSWSLLLILQGSAQASLLSGIFSSVPMGTPSSIDFLSPSRTLHPCFCTERGRSRMILSWSEPCLPWGFRPHRSFWPASLSSLYVFALGDWMTLKADRIGNKSKTCHFTQGLCAKCCFNSSHPSPNHTNLVAVAPDIFAEWEREAGRS